MYIPSNRVSDNQSIPSLKLSAISVIFRYTVGTRVSTVIASLDFTSRGGGGGGGWAKPGNEPRDGVLPGAIH